MSIFKCKVCGGALDISADQKTAVCQYCDTEQTLPRLDDERRINLYDRANHFRRNNEFDKAMGIYEQILNEDSSDAEAYWSLVLCRYGIEYVEDPATRKWVPTINRAQYTSVLADENYKLALQYADSYQKRIYEEEAKTINEIQKGILAISQKEEPFDIFICYKETDEYGDRTKDSVLANELYHQLTQEGFKVFFSRITLEDKLGTAYEPYIFAALNSSKIMVALGMKPEYFNAVWVKNEWSRYLALIKNDSKKTLIPAYRDMDPYDLPEEFSHLQALDMSKLGFMQDLIRGIKKIIGSETKQETVKEKVVVSSGNLNIAPLLKRVFMFLEDANWKDADEYCEKVLDQDPENAQAYLGKLMAELRVSKVDNLKDCSMPFDRSNNYQKTIRFADPDLADTLKEYIAFIKNRNEQTRLSGIYNDAVQKMSVAESEAEYKDAAKRFSTIKEYKDAGAKAEQCLKKAEECRKDEVYQSANAHARSEYISEYEKAISMFQTIPGWRDVDSKIEYCQTRIEEIKAKAEADRIEEERRIEAYRIEAEQRREQERIAEEKARRKRKRIALVLSGLIVSLGVFAVAYIKVIAPTIKYNAAVTLMQEGSYQEAIAAFELLEGFKDSSDQIVACETAIKDGKYDAAVSLMQEGSYQDAIAAFEQMGGYKDSNDQIVACETAIKDGKYDAAVSLMQEGSYQDAIAAFEQMDGYRDSNEQIAACEIAINDGKYDAAMEFLNNGDYISAGELFDELGDYKDSNNQYQQIIQQIICLSNVGDIIQFGNYEWQILAKENNKTLIITTGIVNKRPYNSKFISVTWEGCTLQEWLNNEFYNEFSDEEKLVIATTHLENKSNAKYGTEGGNETDDKIFLLSIDEAKEYFADDDARALGSFWWLRSPGSHGDLAALVLADGSLGEYGDAVNCAYGFRPALWINLE